MTTLFANAEAFGDAASALRAIGADLSGSRSIVDARGKVLARATNGGMLGPSRFELHPGEVLHRFGDSRMSPRQAAEGAWWLQRREFERLVGFANAHGIHVGLALRLLCGVPPEWSDVGLVVRARVVRGLLAWRGLANSVVVPMDDGLGELRLPHHNAAPERRIHQLFIPGLGGIRALEPAVSIEDARPLRPEHSMLGFLHI